LVLVVSRLKQKTCALTHRYQPTIAYEPSEWTDCTLEPTLFDGSVGEFLNTLARKNIPVNKNRFISPCPKHFDLGVQRLTPAKANPERPTKALAV
jgi:hypothetical protein